MKTGNFMSGYRKYGKMIFSVLLTAAAYNLYFIFLLPEVKLFYLLYLDFLILCLMAVYFGRNIRRERQRQHKKEELLKQDFLVYQEIDGGEDRDITVHDVAVLEKQLNEQFTINCDLQDYFAKWCHEIKIPLTAVWLMVEKLEEPSLKKSMKEQVEKMNMQLKSALLGAKVQSSLFDLQIQKTSLLQCVKNSIHNNQFFLIDKHFSIEMPDTTDISVYTDPAWLTYVLDQLISNSIKYAGENPTLTITYSYQGDLSKKRMIQLSVQDNGEGIKESDIRRIFEKGYVGANYHNGQYKSTGMGLYMASVILQRLGHGIEVESEYGKGARFTISFSDNREYFLTKL
ncbi:MAG: sensor histidine kinase [Bacillus sp. (in: Bacteria)]|nr:sensor histidine kinase [Bacillus sp. (in: firmicutes)]MCM1427891.1 sensor histidine kinase [Eubacterium sp.]